MRWICWRENVNPNPLLDDFCLNGLDEVRTCFDEAKRRIIVDYGEAMMDIYIADAMVRMAAGLAQLLLYNPPSKIRPGITHYLSTALQWIDMDLYSSS